MSSPTVSIIIVSWNVRALLEKCLQSIERTKGNLDVEVFVVDNASTDGTTEWLHHSVEISKYRNIEILLNKENRGFAAANNQAIRSARGEYILLLNPDTELQDGALQKMLAFMDETPHCGILGPKLLNTDRTVQRSIRRFPDAWSPLLFSLGVSRGSVASYLAHDIDYAHAQHVDQVMGACFLIRRAVIDALGLFDERFFIWFEEVDYCRRARNAGWEIWYTPTATVLHHGGESFAQVLTLKKQWMFSKSLLYYFRKHRQWGAFVINSLAVPLRLFVALPMSIFRKVRKKHSPHSPHFSLT